MSGDEPKPWTTYSLLFDVFVLGQAVSELLGEAMAEGPLRPVEYAVYSVVFEEERISPTGMARQLAMPLTTAVWHVREMERRGHARRIENPDDRRSYLVVLTADGLRAHAEAHGQFEAAYQRVLAALPADPEAVRTSLRSLAAAARSATGRHGAVSDRPFTSESAPLAT